MKTIQNILIAAVLLITSASAQQNTLTSTTLSAAMTASQQTIALASYTGVNAPSASVPASALYIVDPGERVGELVKISKVVNSQYFVSRTAGNNAKAHASGAIVWVATIPSYFQSANPQGACVTATAYVTPWINTNTGEQWNCDDQTLTWVNAGDQFFFVPPTQCTTAPTTSTVTNTYPQIGASTVFVLNATTNAAAGTTTLVCNIQVPGRIGVSRGAFLTDVVVAVGSQTTAPTSIGTATLGTISMPVPVATTQTASTVTPVTAGALTQLGPTTTVLTVTTAGAFLTFKYTPAAPVPLTTDNQLLQFTVPYLQSAAAAMTLNWPGLWVHYVMASK